MLLPKLNSRYCGSELMDDLEANKEPLEKTLDHFRLINRLFSRSGFVIFNYIFKDIVKNNRRKVTLLDIGSGGGDIDRWFVERARSSGITASVVGIDHDKRCIEYAVKKSAGFHELSFMKMDVFDLNKIDIAPDYIIANHFLHHMDNCKIPQFLSMINKTALRGFLINDLLRSKLSYVFFFLLYPFLGRRSFTWKDGLMSIRKGFTCNELDALIKSAGLGTGVKLFTLAPGRIILTNL